MKNRKLFFLISLILCITVLPSVTMAESGQLYTAKVNKNYRHPITNEIEDSGGEQSYSIGQGMVKGAAHDTALIEKTSNKEIYVTIVMSLADYVSDHSIWVQERGASGWQETESGFTGEGSDSNGSTKFLTVKIPDESSILRFKMYVEPMGRDVIWYMNFSDLTKGNNTGLNPVYVTSQTDEKVIKKEEKQEKENKEKENKEKKDKEITKKNDKLIKDKAESKVERKTKEGVLGDKQTKHNDKKTSDLTKSKISEEDGLILSSKDDKKSTISDKASKEKSSDKKEPVFSKNSLIITAIILASISIVGIFFYLGKKFGGKK